MHSAEVVFEFLCVGRENIKIHQSVVFMHITKVLSLRLEFFKKLEQKFALLEATIEKKKFE